MSQYVVSVESLALITLGGGGGEGGARFRLLGGQGRGPNSQQAHDVRNDVDVTYQRRIDVISTSCAH